MAKLTAEKRKKQLAELRALIEGEGQTDRILGRIAQAIEYGVRYATLDTRSWSKMANEARLLADLLRREI